ncbi:MAG: hypothetical protein RIK87_15090 [Fuerstiella sp.]
MPVFARTVIRTCWAGQTAPWLVLLVLLLPAGPLCAAEDSGSDSDATDTATDISVDTSVATNVEYTIRIAGDIITPSSDGPVPLPVTSDGEFRFRDVPCPTELGGPFTLRAVRLFETAATSTTVGKDLVTRIALSPAYRTIHIYGSDKGLQQVSPGYALPRKQLDLLQMPFDVLPATALLPGTDVRLNDKWNVDTWVLPMMTGIEAVVEQSATCTLKTLTQEQAVVSFSGKVRGAVQGSSSDVSFSGDLTIDRRQRTISSLNVVQQEKRSPGPVSPGLDVTVTVRWQQQPLDGEPPVDALEETAPTMRQQLLFLQTPLKLQLQHSREWHLFHETPAVLMLRQLRDGHLISQCNISAAVTVPPGQHTADREFLADVTEAVRERKGRVLSEETVREDPQWRIRRIRAIGEADANVILWDYFLCSAATGEQYSIVFSHSRNDDQLFGDEANRILATLQVRKPRAALPFR